MTYQDFLSTLVSPINYFINWLSIVADSLIHNYIFITMFGIVLFISLVWLVYDIIDWFFYSHINDYDDYNDRMYDYKLLKEVQSDYLDNNYSNEFDYRYRSKVLNGQVLNVYLSQNKDLDIDNKRLSNSNKMESLKKLKEDILHDDDVSNDDDLDLIIPPKPQLSSINELKHKNKGMSSEELKEFQADIASDIFFKWEKLLNENKNLLLKHDLKYDRDAKVFYNFKTGEVYSIPETKQIKLGNFVYYDKLTKTMKNIALPIIDSDNTFGFDFDNDNLSDYEKDFIKNNTLIRK